MAVGTDCDKTRALALMAWIAAHTGSDGSAIDFNADGWALLSDETGMTAEEGKIAVDSLIAEGLVTPLDKRLQIGSLYAQ